jgi:hypothetical protein
MASDPELHRPALPVPVYSAVLSKVLMGLDPDRFQEGEVQAGQFPIAW